VKDIAEFKARRLSSTDVVRRRRTKKEDFCNRDKMKGTLAKVVYIVGFIIKSLLETERCGTEATKRFSILISK
jgi:hypothetical protein